MTYDEFSVSKKSKSRDKVENQRQKYEKIFRRIAKFRKYTNEMCSLISNHAVKVAALRDKNDEVARCLDDYTKIEEFSTTSKLSMAVAAELMATVGDHQDLAVQRTETLVLPNLASYSRICDCIKADVWNAIQAIQREKRKKKSVSSLKKKACDPKTKNSLIEAQRELERASAETARFCELSEEQVIKFEHKRLMDLKESLGQFLKIQIASHAKSLELLSETFKHIQSIDENGDLDILKACLNIGESMTNATCTPPSKKKSQKSFNSGPSEKSSSSNVKAKPENRKNSATNDTSESTSDEDNSNSNESIRSEMVRHLEKVLHHDKPKRESYTSPPRRKSSHHHNNYHQEKGNATDHHHSNNRNSRSTHDDLFYSDDHGEKHHHHRTMKQKMLCERPSTPSRPITVPTGGRGGGARSSTEDLSTRQDNNMSFKSRKNKSALTTETYYYSQSEDEKRKVKIVPPTQGTQKSRDSQSHFAKEKHVTFYNDNDGSYHHQPTQSSKHHNNSSTNYNNNYYDNNYSSKPIGSSKASGDFKNPSNYNQQHRYIPGGILNVDGSAGASRPVSRKYC